MASVIEKRRSLLRMCRDERGTAMGVGCCTLKVAASPTGLLGYFHHAFEAFQLVVEDMSAYFPALRLSTVLCLVLKWHHLICAMALSIPMAVDSETFRLPAVTGA